MLLEVCVDSLAGLEAAVAGGADRIELCAALSVGGLTPAAGLVAAAARVAVPAYAMIRPRPGDFVFTDADMGQMEADIAAMGVAGLAGVVVGASHDDGTLDVAGLRRLTMAAGPLGVTLHRAFDVAPDPAAAIELGCARVLTSGGQRRAVDGTAVIRRLVEQARGRICVMAGGGVTPGNVAALVAATGVTEVHGSAAVAVRPGIADALGFGGAEIRVADVATVRRLKAVLAAPRKAYDGVQR